MLFLHVALLSGLAAVLVPIIIHLWNRRNARIVDWGAMQFLRNSINRRTRRIRLEEALLLACRCLLVGLIVLAVARPFSPPGSQVPWVVVLPAVLLGVALLGASFAFPSHSHARHFLFLAASLLFGAVFAAVLFENRLHLSRFSVKEEQDVVLVLDTSPSTLLTSGRGTGNAFDQLVDEAREIVSRSGAGASFAILTTTDGAAPVLPILTGDRKAVDAALRSLNAVDAPASIPDTIAQALSILGDTGRARRILILTDSQKHDWNLQSDSLWAALRTAAGETKTPALAIHRTQPPEEVRNLAVTGIELSRDVIGTDRPAGIIATIRNTGSEAVTPTAVRLSVNGTATASNTAAGQVGPGQLRTIRFDHLFASTGAQSVTIEIEVDDDLPADNMQGHALLVRGGIKVLVIDGNRAPRFLDRAGAFVQLALAPGLSVTGQLAETESVAAEAAADIQDFSRYEAVVLASVPRIPSAVRKRLEDFVEGGGGLLVLHDQRADKDFYNNWPILPGRLESWSEREPNSPAKIALDSITHHSLRKLTDAEQGDFDKVELRGFWSMSLPDASAPAAALDDGSPFALIQPAGNGTVARLCTTLDNRNSNLATRDSFVPFVHELVYFLANPAGSRLHLETARSPMSVRFPARSTAPLTAGDQPLAVYRTTGPDGNERQAAIHRDRDKLTARVPGPPVAGVYRIFVPADAVELRALTANNSNIPFSIGRPAGESDMGFLDEGDLTRLNRHFPAAMHSEVDATLDVLSGRVRGKELWKPLAIAAFILIVLEIVLTRWIARGRNLDREIVAQASLGEGRSL